MRKATTGMALGLLLLAGTAGADILHVPDVYETIQEAVDASTPGDIIKIAAGFYQDPTHDAPGADSSLCCVVVFEKTDLTFSGAGMGATIVDADSLGRGFHIDSSEGIIVQEMTIQHASAEVNGAGILCRFSSPTLRNLELANNYDRGIGVSDSSSPDILHCYLHDNEAKAAGALGVATDCEPYIYGCQIVNNTAPFAAGMRLRGSATIEYCLIDGNMTTDADNVVGGGILVTGEAAPTIRYCTITNHSCRGDGGGVCFQDGGGLLENCYIAGNSGTSFGAVGGGVFVASLTVDVEIRDCVIANNYTDYDDTGDETDGGGMWIQYTNALVQNCTFYGNWTGGEQPDYGNAGNVGFQTSMFIPATIQLSHCIITESPQRGVYCHVDNTGDPPQIDCCDIWNNALGDDLDCAVGSDNFSEDPDLCDPAGGNFHILLDSPCAPGNHPGGAGTCGDALIGAKSAGCDADVEEEVSATDVLLHANRPNPFEGWTVIRFEIPRSERVSLEVYDPAGRRVAVLKRGLMAAGAHHVTWDGTTLTGEPAASGVYFYRLRAGSQTAQRRMLHLR